MKSRFLAIVFVLGGAVLVVPEADAQGGSQDKRVRVGLQASFATDTDLGIGARAIFDLSGHRQGLTGIASFDYFFVGDDGLGDFLGIDVNYWEANGNLVYALDRTGSVQPYLGAGVNFAHVGVSSDFGGGSDSDIGLNALGGLAFGKDGRVFVEGRLTLGGGDQFVVTAGLRF